MKLNCDVIRDLLPLYHDGICSEESQTLVEEHLAECAACKNVLHTLQEEIVLSEELNAAKPLEAIRDMWKKSKWKAWTKGFAVAMLICIVLAGGFFGLTQWYCVPMGSEDLEVVEVCQLDNGRIFCHLGVRDQEGFGWFEYTLTEDGILYLTLMRPIVVLNQNWSYARIQFDPDNITGYRGIENGTEIIAFYFGTPEDHLIIWEEGMELPVASELEAYGVE